MPAACSQHGTATAETSPDRRRAGRATSPRTCKSVFTPPIEHEHVSIAKQNDPTAADPPDPGTSPPGRTSERYQVIGEHGRGGLGVVSRAHDRDLGRDVAIKELLARGHSSEARFLREARITARLEHPGIVPVHEAGRWPDGTPFYAMKLVAGRPLRELITERHTVAERINLLHHVIAVADAIAYAHARNIIHRDLKPANVIVGDFGETIVIDWGLAKDLAEREEVTTSEDPLRSVADGNLTTTGIAMGTPAYMAPEQERGEHVDQRADVFAIGAMLWELCSLHKVPPMDIRHRHRLLRRAGIDTDLVAIVDKALAPERAHRYPDAGALAADLKAFKSGARIGARRYSLFAMLIHWTRRHRALAASMVAALVLGATVSVLYVRSVTDERDRADAARDHAELEKRRAIIANALELLERDPTQAWSAIKSLGSPTRDTAVLRARIRAAGVADATMTFPTRMDNIAVTPSRTRILIATVDRTLSMVDLQTHLVRRLTDGMTEPAIFATTNSHAYVVHKRQRLVLTKISLDSGQEEELIDLAQLPEDLMVGEAGVFWHNVDGSLHELLPSHMSRLIATNVAQFSLAGAKIAICDKNHTLRIVASNETGASLGHCMETWAWGERDGNFAVPIDGRQIAVYQNGKLRQVQFASGRGSPSIALSNTGLIAAIDAHGNGAYLAPGADAFQSVKLSHEPVSTAAEGTMIAWSFPDGRVKVLDSATGREWSIKAHAQGALCVYVLPPGDRLLTCGRSELRLWTLPPDAPILVAEMPAATYNLVRSGDGSFLLDSGDGGAYLLPGDLSQPTLLHKHSLLSFGVASCGSQLCSASWDGQILCSSVDKTTETVAALGIPIRWIDGGAGHCFVAVSSGGIYDLLAPATAAYWHDHEPYRLAVSYDGTRVASGDWGGTIKVWDIEGQRVVLDLPHLHAEQVTEIDWLNSGGLVTAGSDGYVRKLDHDFKVVHSWRLGAPVRYMSASDDSIFAALANGNVWSVAPSTMAEHQISLGGVITAFAVSPSRKYMAIGNDNGELFIIDAQRKIAVMRFESDIVRCAIFINDQTMLICAPANRIMYAEFRSKSFEPEMKY